MRILTLALVALLACEGGREPDKHQAVDTDAPEDTAPPVSPFDCATSQLTWENWAGPFFTTWCTPCHSATVVGDMRKGAPTRANFDEYQNVLYFLPAIAIAVPQTDPLAEYPPRMPPGGGVSDVTKFQLAEWIACGAKEGDPPAIDLCAEVSVVPGDLVVDSQATIDAFCAAGNAVGGDLTLTAPGDVVVDCLCEVQGDILVSAGESTTIDLPELRTVTGSVTLDSTTLLTDFSANSLAEIPGDFSSIGTNGLLQVHFLAVSSVGGAWSLFDNKDLGVVEFPQVVSIAGLVNVNDNPDLLVLDLMRVRDVGGDVTFKFNNSLGELPAFDSLETVGGDLVIDENPGLTRLSWFQSLLSIAGDLEIADNNDLVDIYGFWLLDSVGGALNIARNEILVSVLGMELLQSAGSITFADNGLLTAASFPALTSVGDLTLRNNDVLIGFEGSALLLDAGLVAIDDNDAMVGMTGFESVASARGFVITSNELLRNVSGLPLVTSLDGSLVLLDNPALTEVGDWSSLEEIHGTLRAENNDVLLTTAGLETDTLVDGDLAVIGNATLADLAGQAGLLIVGGDVVITDNPLLPLAAIDAVVNGLSTIGGTVQVSGNGG